MIEVCKKIIPYKCAKCGQEMLFFYTDNGLLIDYKVLFEKEKYNLFDIKKYIQYKRIKYLKCITCNQLYIIDWTGGYPKPLYDTKCLSDFGIK